MSGGQEATAVTVRHAGPADLDQVMEIERECFGDWRKGQRRAWSPTAWRADLDATRAPGATTGRIVLLGCQGSRAVAVADFHHLAEVCDLDRIMVRRADRRTGVAGRLLEAGMEWARGRGAERLMLEVHDDNVEALRLYRSHGFSTIGRRAGYYGPGQDALVMSAPLGASPRCDEGSPSDEGSRASNEERHV